MIKKAKEGMMKMLHQTEKMSKETEIKEPNTKCGDEKYKAKMKTSLERLNSRCKPTEE